MSFDPRDLLPSLSFKELAQSIDVEQLLKAISIASLVCLVVGTVAFLINILWANSDEEDRNDRTTANQWIAISLGLVWVLATIVFYKGGVDPFKKKMVVDDEQNSIVLDAMNAVVEDLTKAVKSGKDVDYSGANASSMQGDEGITWQ